MIQVIKSFSIYSINHNPFGMSMSKNSTTTPYNRYKYNGKLKRSGNPVRSGEEQEMPGKWLDYGARMYDAQLGRWHSVDLIAEVSRRWSPYNYCVNNPMRFIDPDGMLVGKYLDQFGNEIGDNGLLDNKVYVLKTASINSEIYPKGNGKVTALQPKGKPKLLRKLNMELLQVVIFRKM